MSDDLVERARLAIAAEWGCAQPCRSQPECTCARDARLAANMALEEAAKVCDEYSASEMKFFNAEGGLASLGRANAAEDLAAAIRAMVKEPT